MVSGNNTSSGRRKREGSQSFNEFKRERLEEIRRQLSAQRRDGGDDHASNHQYRNRALERSQLKDEYYRRVVEEHALLKQQTEDESRYMGGDEERTHLVKGLDYVLLEKVRRNLSPRIREEKTVDEDIPESGHTDLGRYMKRTFLQHTHMHHRNYRDRLSNTYDLLCKGFKLKRDDVGTRIFYRFDLSMEPCANDVPPTVVSNDDSLTSTTMGDLRAQLSADLRKEIGDVLEWHRENRKKPKEERLAERPSKLGDTSDADSDDIFADAGEYHSDELNVNDVSKLTVNGHYFGDSGDSDDPDTYNAAVHLPTLGRRERREKLVDAYDECYPMAADSDSDDDVKGGRKKQKSDRSDWRKIEQLVSDKNTIPMEQLEQASISKKAK
ncbi:hypothetical protein BBOV_III004110 [Babesia bovis T2Bo]|uniref:RED-like N-terminal domain-containing protein n=1 Tax=Babesia bovis TaxID=5865 RepID=A7AN40_BABBO|nr:hypothetical protein BBOV_III004110 [Babesia bovis T2Bo]EDO07974.1 hypothetical protein BBOV_III004110 [Babesia bovis T2Bo]|eukprot:XP_001611542.1 hypothetical protein [Babesia bovis T2Bo]